ncbi:MAG: redoxin domain-containing protein [Frankia sp.]
MRIDRQRRRVGWTIGAAAALCALTIALTGCSGASNSVDQSAGGSFGFVQQSANSDFVPAAHRKVAPDLTGPTLTGGSMSLASLRGRIVVVNFWASWCGPCRGETPGLVSVAKTHPRVAFLGVNEKDNLSNGKAFAADNHVPYPSIVDRIGQLAAAWPVSPGLPSTFVLDAQGRIAARFTGGTQPSDLTPIFTKLQAET